MDDFVLIHPSKRYLLGIWEKLEVLLKEELRLELNSKTQILPIRCGVDYLGFHFYLTETGKVIRKLRTAAKVRFKRRLGHMQKGYSTGDITLEKINASLASSIAHLNHGHAYKLLKNNLDKFVLRKTAGVK